MELEKLSFEAWIQYVFDHPVDKKMAWYFRSNRPYWNETTYPRVTVEYLTRFFSKPDSFAVPYSDAQLNQGLWFLADTACSNHMYILLTDSVPVEKRIACIHSIFALYERLFSIRCSDHLSHTLYNDDPSVNPLNLICYMWWDVLPVYAKPHDTSQKQIELACLDVMEKTLSLKSLACQESALHGLGHWNQAYPERIREIIDQFLKVHPTTPLQYYAKSARDSVVL